MGLSLTRLRLKIDQFRHVGMDKDVMAPSNCPFHESQSLNHLRELVESDMTSFGSGRRPCTEAGEPTNSASSFP